MGAWIETFLSTVQLAPTKSHPTWVRGLKRVVVNFDEGEAVSHPTWVRGLKLACDRFALPQPEVAPYVGAWIETGTGMSYKGYTPVAPYVGAWIETLH